VYPSHRNQTKTDTSSSRWQVVCSPCEALSLVTVCVETILVLEIFVRFLFYSILYLHVDLWYVCTSTVLGWCVYVYPSYQNQTKTDTSSSRWQVVCSPCEVLSIVTVCVETILVLLIFVPFLFYSILYLYVDLWYVCTSTVLGWCVYVCVRCICIYLSMCMCVCVCKMVSIFLSVQRYWSYIFDICVLTFGNMYVNCPWSLCACMFQVCIYILYRCTCVCVSFVQKPNKNWHVQL